ncbi:alpha-mannosidase, partial [Deinococcus pimensis]|uniref:alpha-mannosidase n=1 Tax=Deinococcus pimensis TaxID=309888 RepID=UPI003CCC2947
VRLAAGLARLLALFPPDGAFGVSGHAHLDLGWLWPVHETRRKSRRTFETVLTLMDRFPDFTFNGSSAQVYAWLEEQHPDLFERVRARVLEGRIEPVGGMWVEPDANMLGGESWARQLLYGQRYFREKFGRTSRVAWLPDTFGFTPALPQLLLAAGVTGFFTTKLNWSETTVFPHDLFTWEGLDGSRVLAHSFRNHTWGVEGLGTYNGDLSPTHLRPVWQDFRGRALPVWDGGAPESLFTYGYGDGGGGPSAEMLERFERLREYPASPRLRHTRVDDFFDGLPRDGLPVWSGELYLELHRATLSSQGRTKKLHREAEHRLVEAEVTSSLATWQGGDPRPDPSLEAAWKALLLAQFHDILPGSSIREVYEDAEPALRGVVDTATRARDAALAALSDGTEGTFTVVNPDARDRPL